MDQPAVCPVCGDNSIVPVERVVKPEESVVDILAFLVWQGAHLLGRSCDQTCSLNGAGYVGEYGVRVTSDQTNCADHKDQNNCEHRIPSPV
jgi:hypothetical protein